MDIFDATHKLDNCDTIIWNNEKEFLEKFTYDGEQLIETWYGPYNFAFAYLIETGDTLFEIIKLDELQEWFDDLGV